MRLNQMLHDSNWGFWHKVSRRVACFSSDRLHRFMQTWITIFRDDDSYTFLIESLEAGNSLETMPRVVQPKQSWINGIRLFPKSLCTKPSSRIWRRQKRSAQTSFSQYPVSSSGSFNEMMNLSPATVLGRPGKELKKVCALILGEKLVSL